MSVSDTGYARLLTRSSDGSVEVDIDLEDDDDEPADEKPVKVFPIALDKVSAWRQWISSLCYCIGAFAMGNMIGWSSPALPKMEAVNSTLAVSSYQAAWIGSIICLGALIQAPFSGFLVNRIGRRGIMLANCPILVAGWMTIVYAESVSHLYIGRLITGFACGAFSVAAPIFVGEIASPEIRGKLGSLFQLMVVAGICFVYMTGAYLSWRASALLCAAVPVGLFIGVFYLHDSPVSYMIRGRPEMARKAIVWLRNSAGIEEEIYAVQRAADESRRSSRLKAKEVLLSKDPTIRKPMLLAAFIMANNQFTGINAVMSFSVNIFQSSGTSIDPNQATILIGVIQLLATTVASWLVTKASRRVTLISSLFVIAVALFAFGAYFEYKASLGYLEWLPLACLTVFIIAFSMGPGPLGWILLGELMSPKIAGVAGGLASVLNWGMAFAITVAFPFLVESVGESGTYWLFAFLTTFGLYIVAKFLPETKGKTLKEIQDSF